MKKVLQRVLKAIKNFKNRKARFVYSCAGSFYYHSGKAELDGIGFLPFLNDQHKLDWAKRKAREFVNECIKNNTLDAYYSLFKAQSKIKK